MTLPVSGLRPCDRETVPSCLLSCMPGIFFPLWRTCSLSLRYGPILIVLIPSAGRRRNEEYPQSSRVFPDNSVHQKPVPDRDGLAVWAYGRPGTGAPCG